MVQGDSPVESVTVAAIDRALLLLEELAACGSQGAPLAHLARETGISKPTAYRALVTMRERGFVSQGRNGEYILGPRSLWLAEQFESTHHIVSALRPALIELSELTEELVHLGAWDGDDVVYLEKVEPARRAVRVWSSIGQRVPAASSSLGRILLAARSDDDASIDRYLAKLPPDRAVSRERLAQVVAEARDSGCATEIEENEPGVACLGWAIMKGTEPVAAISVTTVAARFTEEHQNHLKRIVRRHLPPLLPSELTLFSGMSVRA